MIVKLLIYDTEKSIRTNEFAADVKEGLAATKKYLKPKYFYNDMGSKLFEEICRQPEYYLTRTETSILRKYKRDILRICGHHDISIIELGSGSSSKTKILLNEFVSNDKNVFYFPIDVSETMLNDSIDKLSTEFKNLRVIGVCSEYASGIKEVNVFMLNHSDVPGAKLLVFLGSSIGNLDQVQVRIFLTALKEQMNYRDAILIGFDLQKEIAILENAYNDKAGITAHFNLNLLARINRELHAQFNLSFFRHEAFYNVDQQRIEMRLVSTCDQSVFIRGLGEHFSFKKDERIHTENSYKFSLDGINKLAIASGLRVIKNYTDSQNLYCLSLLSRVPDTPETGK